jgi:toxin FitB
MFLLDTNVVSELRKVRLGKADTRVAQWSETTEPSAFYISAITVLELEAGILMLERRDPNQGAALRAWLENRVLLEFVDRILPVDIIVARMCARLHVRDPRPERDAMIAATALVHGMMLVTRNVRDFLGTGANILNPWTDRLPG